MCDRSPPIYGRIRPFLKRSVDGRSVVITHESTMNQGLATVIGMSIAYAASVLGLLLAWRSYRKHHRKEEEQP